jgi:16S rRNA processing protein RimM
MTYSKGILLGRIIKVKGFKGTVTVKLEQSFIENIPHAESVFLEINGKPVPFFISHLEYAGADLIRLRFEGYDSLEKIREFAGCRVFLASSIVSRKEQASVEDLTKYKIYTQGDKLLGTVSGIISNPGQSLLTVLSTGHKEILIPFHEDFILSIDKKKKVIFLELPEGLIEIN